MASKKLILTEAGAPRYRTRMLKAGDSVVLGGPKARLFEQMGWAEEPSAKVRDPRPAERIIPTVEEVLSAEVVGEPAEEAPTGKRRGRRRAKK